MGSFCAIPGCPRSQALPAEAAGQRCQVRRGVHRWVGFLCCHRNAGHGLVVGGMGTSPALTSRLPSMSNGGGGGAGGQTPPQCLWAPAGLLFLLLFGAGVCRGAS